MNEKKKTGLLILAIIFIAFNLRAAVTGVGPLISMLQADLGLSSGAAGFITTIPLLAFATMSPLVSRFTERAGAGKAIGAALLILIIGLLIRSYCGIIGLFAGTALAGAGVSFGNVLLPALIKDRFPEKEGTLTGVYTSGMSLFASVAAGISLPLAAAFGWKHAMAVWILLAAVTLAIWKPFWNMQLSSDCAGGERGTSVKGMCRHPVAVWLSLFMGLQCVLFYCFVSWLPTILEAKGFDAETAGWLFSLYQLAGIPGSFLAPVAAGQKQDQRNIVYLCMILYFAGMGLLTFGGSGFVPISTAVTVCGFCSGACISLTMLMIGRRTRNPAAAGQLSGLVQSAGYIIAAAGPFAMGLVYDLTENWTLTLVLLLVLMVPMAVSAVKSAEDRYIA